MVLQLRKNSRFLESEGNKNVQSKTDPEFDSSFLFHWPFIILDPRGNGN